MEMIIDNRKVIDIMPLLNLKNIECAPSSRMGASSIGEQCERKLWLKFHWVMKDNISGKNNLIFGIGSTLEDVMGELLEERSNVTPIMEKSLSANGLDIKYTGKDQLAIDVAPHFVVKPDGIIFSGVPTAEKTIHVWENKTMKSKYFNELKKNGIKSAQPKHYDQMQIEMLGASIFLGSRIERGLYTVINKDSAEVYAERVDRDDTVISALLAKAERIRLSPQPPEKISEIPTWDTCKFCSYSHFCHFTNEAENINCRTCAHSTPEEDGTWSCRIDKDFNLGHGALSLEEQKSGCQYHVFNPSLVPWPIVQECSTDYACAYEVYGGQIILNGWGGVTSEELKKESIPPKQEGWEVEF